MEAADLLKDVTPSTPQEYILQGVVNASVGQMTDSPDHLKKAREFFELVGASKSECDTIPGRQCMASCFILLKQFEDVLIYLTSIQSYCANDPIFNYNFGVALAASERYPDALKALLDVKDEHFCSEYIYISWLARCFIMTGQPQKAWELYLKMESDGDTFNFLQLVANDCYKVGAFYYAAKAFGVLERVDPSTDYWEGKRGACCGVLQQVIAQQAPPEQLREIMLMLRSAPSSTPQAGFICNAMAKWAQENGLSI
jgi:intraflagellar transport protein 56